MEINANQIPPEVIEEIKNSNPGFTKDTTIIVTTSPGNYQLECETLHPIRLLYNSDYSAAYSSNDIVSDSDVRKDFSNQMQ